MERVNFLTSQILASWVTIESFSFDPTWNLDDVYSDFSHICMAVGEQIIFGLIDLYSVGLELLFFQVGGVSNVRKADCIELFIFSFVLDYHPQDILFDIVSSFSE